MKLAIAIAICLALVFWNSKQLERCRKKADNPETYDDYLTKLCYISKKSAYDIFVIAAETIPKYIVDRDFRKYLETSEVPEYVKEFLDEGKETIKEANVSPFTYWGNL